MTFATGQRMRSRHDHYQNNRESCAGGYDVKDATEMTNPAGHEVLPLHSGR